MSNPKILAFSGSTRSESINSRLVGSAVRELDSLDCEVTRIDLSDYPLPLYDGDFEADHGIPENAMKLARLMDASDGFFIVCPEYNGSLSPLMKNTIDWVSRVSDDKGREVSAYKGKLAAIASVSPGGICLLYTSPSPRDKRQSRMPSSA